MKIFKDSVTEVLFLFPSSSSSFKIKINYYFLFICKVMCRCSQATPCLFEAKSYYED